MGHSVHFRDAAGEVQLEDVDTLDAALEHVERLRNEDGATEIRVFREVPIEVRTYYRAVALDETAGVDVTGAAEPETDGPVGAPFAAVEPPSGAMMMSPPPVSVVPEPSSADHLGPALAPAPAPAPEPAAGEPRRQLFSRS